MSNLKKYFKSKYDRIIYKRISPFIGRILDKLFFTSFSRKGINFYHYYERNDYKIDSKEKICFVHLPRTGGIATWKLLKENNILIYNFPKGSFHNPVSLKCSPRDFKYLTIMREPIDRIYSQFNNFGEIGGSITNHGLLYTLRTQQSFKNLACQYYSGLIDETVDQRIFEIAKENLGKFYQIIDFNNLETDLINFFKKHQISKKINIENPNKSVSKKITFEEKESIRLYNYWDLKLYEYYKNNILNR